MSTPTKYVLEVLPSPKTQSSLIDRLIDYCSRKCLDLGGGNGALREAMEYRGYRYINLDLCRYADVIGDSHGLAFQDNTFHLIISKDSLEHFYAPKKALAEVGRVLRKGGHLIILVPWMHPFHKTDYFRFSPLGLRDMLEDLGLEIEIFDAPAWIFTILATIGARACSYSRLPHLGRILRKLGYFLDDLFAPGKLGTSPSAFASEYRIRARKK